MPKFLYVFIFLISFFACKTSPKNPTASINTKSQIDRIENFDSKFISKRNIDIWLPADYSKEEKYAVLYMHDGQMLYDSTQSWNKQEWGVDEKMDALIRNHSIRQTIVVGIWNTKDRHAEYFPQKPFESLPKSFQDSWYQLLNKDKEKKMDSISIQSDNYLRFIVAELKPFIDKNYSTLTDRDHTFVMGSSMGGLISMYAICEYPEIFGGAACLSTHWTGTMSNDKNPIPAAFVDYLKEKLPSPDNHKLYFDYGTETLDSLYEPYQLQVDTVMSEKGFDENNWVTMKFEGADHSERSWKYRLGIPLNFLLGKDQIGMFGQHYQLYKDFGSLEKVVELTQLGGDTTYLKTILGEPIDMGFDYRYLVDSTGPNGCVIGAVFHFNDKSAIDQKWIDEICE